MEKILHLNYDGSIAEIQQEFNNMYSFLRIQFYRISGVGSQPKERKVIVSTSLLRAANLTREGTIVVDNNMTVAELERKFSEDFGLTIQVTRQSGILWLETTVTNNMSLQQQNEHGMEITCGVGKTARLDGGSR